jgi:hypothetical protein
MRNGYIIKPISVSTADELVAETAITQKCIDSGNDVTATSAITG